MQIDRSTDTRGDFTSRQPCQVIAFKHNREQHDGLSAVVAAGSHCDPIGGVDQATNQGLSHGMENHVGACIQ